MPTIKPKYTAKSSVELLAYKKNPKCYLGDVYNIPIVPWVERISQVDFPNYRSRASMDNEQWTMKSKALASNETMNNEYCMTTPLLNVSADEVDRVAHYLVTKLNNPVALKWYCYAAWRLPEPVLTRHLEYALERGRNPSALFTTLIKKELGT